MSAKTRLARWAILASFTALGSACAHGEARPASTPATLARARSLPRVGAFGFTTADLTAEESFFRALQFEERAPVTRLSGSAFERLVGIDGARARAATLGLGSEALVLTAYDAPTGKPIPEPSQSNDLWFENSSNTLRRKGAARSRNRPARIWFIGKSRSTWPMSRRSRRARRRSECPSSRAA